MNPDGAAPALDAWRDRAMTTATAVHRSTQWRSARRYLPVYRWAADLDDRTVATFVAAGWGMWLVGGLVSFALGRPGAAVIGAVLALVGVVVNVAVVRWWMGYRRSPARLRHQILAREQIAAGRELADSSLAAAQVVRLGEHVRPALSTETSVPTLRRRIVATGPDGRTRSVDVEALAGCCASDQDGAVR